MVGFAQRFARRRPGRFDDALRRLASFSPLAGRQAKIDELRVVALEKLGRPAEAQAVRWSAFERSLSYDRFDDYLTHATDDERIVARAKAISRAGTYPYAARDLVAADQAAVRVSDWQGLAGPRRPDDLPDQAQEPTWPQVGVQAAGERGGGTRVTQHRLLRTARSCPSPFVPSGLVRNPNK